VKQSGVRRWLKWQLRLSLSDQFLLISFVILLGGMLIIGWWVANRIEDAVVNQTANTTALYMKSFVAPLLQPLINQNTLDSAQHQQLQRLLVDTPLGQDIVSLKVWSPDGTILFSLEPDLIGTRFPLDEDLQAAFSGQTVSHLSSLSRAEDVMERRFWSNLIETHVPVFAEGTSRVIAVAEFYQYSEPLLQQIADAQRQSWLIVAIATIAMYGLLSGLVARGSRTIDRQQAQLQQSVKDLAALLDENQVLHRRLQAAAAREAEINEQFLHRIGRDLHDGPAQDLALALLHIDEVCQVDPPLLETIRHALQSALHEIRALAAGLQLPELGSMPTADVVRRAVREFQRKTGATVELEPDLTLPPLSLSKKIAIYRVIAEALNLHVQLGVTDQSIWAEIADSGPGFDPTTLSADGTHLGIAGLQQRVALLAGSFDIQSRKDEGTRIRVSLPLRED
jgi:signal transduction histidine kinase